MIFGNSDIMLEKYVGKNHNEFKIVEKELSKLIDIIKKNLKPLADRVSGEEFRSRRTIESVMSGLDVNVLNNSDHTKLIERTLKKFFGLKEFLLIWNVNSVPNAFTEPKSFLLLDPNFKQDKNGHRTNDKLTIGVVLNTGLITYANLNEKEIMATILHEIGHNFYQSVYQVLAHIPLSLKDIIPWSINRFSTVPFIKFTLIKMGIRDIFDIPSILLKGSREFSNLIDKHFPNISKALYVYKDFMYNISSLLAGKVDIEKMYYINNIFRYNVEKNADSFAVDYGYGQHLATALDKIAFAENSLRGRLTEIPYLNWVVDLFELQKELLLRPLSGYPSTQNRIRTGLDRLRRSVNDQTLDPRVRKELERDLAMYEDYYYNVYLKLEENNNQKKIFTWAFANMVEKIFMGKLDLREIVYALDPEKYR